MESHRKCTPGNHWQGCVPENTGNPGKEPESMEGQAGQAGIWECAGRDSGVRDLPSCDVEE